MIAESPDGSAFLAVSGAFISVLSTLKIPSVTGSFLPPCGHGHGCNHLHAGSCLAYGLESPLSARLHSGSWRPGRAEETEIRIMIDRMGGNQIGQSDREQSDRRIARKGI